MSLRAIETVYVQVGVPRKKRLKRACKLTKLSQAKIINAALDRELAILAEKYPELAVKTRQSDIQNSGNGTGD